MRESRAASAGTLRRRPFVRQNQSTTKVTVNKQTPGNNGQQQRMGSTTATPTTQYTGTVPEPQKSHGDPVYDGNGLRLDRTPTDDEINWLWDKVRTCLSRTSTVCSQDTQSQTTDQGSVLNNSVRQPAMVSSKYIDGNSLAPQFRTATRIQQPNGTSMAAVREPTINNNGSSYHTPSRKKVSMDHLNSYGRKASAGLLASRKNTSQSQANGASAGAGGAVNNANQATNITTYQPIYSTQTPTAVSGINQNENGKKLIYFSSKKN